MAKAQAKEKAAKAPTDTDRLFAKRALAALSHVQMIDPEIAKEIKAAVEKKCDASQARPKSDG